MSGQFTWFHPPRGHHNQFTAGAAWDGSSVGFQQSTQLGYLNPDRSVTGVNAFGDGVTGGTVDGEPFDTRVDLHGVIRTGSIYATDTLSLGSAWHFTLSGRYNRTSLVNRDRITPAAAPDRSTAAMCSAASTLPPASPTVRRAPGTPTSSYSEGSRAPTSIELGCADPDQPCKLPNAMAGDPPLDQVVARTWEAGRARAAERSVHWSAGWFRADNRDDILFSSRRTRPASAISRTSARRGGRGSRWT